MSSRITFVNNSVQVRNAIEEAITAFLYEAGGELTSQTARNTAVDTGQLKNSWRYEVDSNGHKCTIGSNLENAIYEEFGTGEYALNRNGRRTPWKYKDRHGKWHITRGKKPRRALYRAFESKKSQIRRQLEDTLKGRLN